MTLAEMRRDVRSGIALALELARRNVRARYRNSLLGYVWLLLTPVVMAGAWVFLRRAGSISFGDVGTSYPLYVATGMLLWQGFSRMLQSPLQQLNASRHLLGKFRFPWEAIVLAAWLEVLLEFSVGMSVLLVVLGATGTLAGAASLAAFPAMVLLLAFGGAVGLLAAPIGLLYEDVGRAIGLALSLLFFLVPIVYPVGASPLARLAVGSNPAAVFLVIARDFLMHGTTAWLSWGLVHGALTMVFLLAGFALLRVARPHLASRA